MKIEFADQFNYFKFKNLIGGFSFGFKCTLYNYISEGRLFCKQDNTETKIYQSVYPN